GRIRKEDDQQVIANKGSASPAAATAPAAAPLVISPLRGTTVPFTRIRTIVAKRAVESMQQTAQVTSVVKADVTNIACLRDQVKHEFHSKTGNKRSLLPFFAMATVEALQAFPIVNSTVEGETIVYPSSENLSIAVDTERGLLTPVIKSAGDLNVKGFA